MFDAMLVIPKSNEICIASQKQLMKYNTISHEFTIESVDFDGAGAEGFMINDSQFICVKDEKITLQTFDEEEGEVLFTNEAMMSGCKPCFAGKYMIITDHDGTMRIFESNYAYQANNHRPTLRWRTEVTR